MLRLLPLIGSGLVTVATVLFSGTATAEFVIKQVSAQLAADELRVSAEVDLRLSNEAQAALENGVPLVVLTEIEVLKPGAFWDETLVKRELRSRLRYHALSDRYVIEREEQGTGMESFRSVGNALRQLGKIRNVEIPVNTLPADTLLAVRSSLDINALPAPLRPMALFSANWRLSSDWTQWQIAR